MYLRLAVAYLVTGPAELEAAAMFARFTSSFPRILLTLRLNLPKPFGLSSCGLAGGLAPVSCVDISMD